MITECGSPSLCNARLGLLVLFTIAAADCGLCGALELIWQRRGIKQGNGERNPPAPASVYAGNGPAEGSGGAGRLEYQVRGSRSHAVSLSGAPPPLPPLPPLRAAARPHVNILTSQRPLPSSVPMAWAACYGCSRSDARPHGKPLQRQSLTLSRYNSTASRDPDRVALAYTEDTEWRNRAEFVKGREAVRQVCG